MSVLDLCSKNFKPTMSRYSCKPSYYVDKDGSIVLHRDSKFLKLKTFRSAKLPSSVDLRKSMPPVYDQQTLGSCTANALCAAYEYDMMKQGEEYEQMSRLFLYFRERSIEGTVYSDSGAQLSNGVKALESGVCTESDWAYNIEKFCETPPQYCFDNAQQHRVIGSHSIQMTLPQIKGALADGYPVAFGFAIFESFEGQEIAKSGVMTMPISCEQLLGGHAVLIVGYDDTKKVLIIRNSWGTSWGDNGYFYMPYDFISDQTTFDPWVLDRVEDKSREIDNITTLENVMDKLNDLDKKLSGKIDLIINSLGIM